MPSRAEEGERWHLRGNDEYRHGDGTEQPPSSTCWPHLAVSCHALRANENGKRWAWPVPRAAAMVYAIPGRGRNTQALRGFQLFGKPHGQRVFPRPSPHTYCRARALPTASFIA